MKIAAASISPQCFFLARTSIFFGDMTLNQLSREYDRGYRVLLDGLHAFHSQLKIEKIRDPLYNELIISLKSHHAYHLDLSKIIQTYLLQRTHFHPIQCDQIITAVHEAYKNALLWSNLELQSSKDSPRPLDFDQTVQERLRQKKYRDRIIHLIINKKNHCLEFCINIEGLPITWPQTPSKTTHLRGTMIIKSLTDKVVIDSDPQTIRLYFLHE